jgi:hypothetical protein
MTKEITTAMIEKQKYMIHYIGSHIEEFPNTDLIDIVWHLGAKYGGRVYNEAVKAGAITIDESNRVVVVRPYINHIAKNMDLVY